MVDGLVRFRVIACMHPDVNFWCISASISFHLCAESSSSFNLYINAVSFVQFLSPSAYACPFCLFVYDVLSFALCSLLAVVPVACLSRVSARPCFLPRRCACALLCAWLPLLGFNALLSAGCRWSPWVLLRCILVSCMFEFQLLRKLVAIDPCLPVKDKTFGSWFGVGLGLVRRRIEVSFLARFGFGVSGIARLDV